MKSLQAALLAATAIMVPVATASAAEDVVIVYDASGSMWGQIDGVGKVEIAREVMADLVNGWSDDTNLGLVAYGHRSEGDCRDIETLIEPGVLDRKRFIETVNAIRPKGKTPISAAVQHAADLMSYRDNPATVVLISDGLETCQADPCALSEQLARQGVKFTTHVIGFDLKDEAHASIACIAENTGGVFVPAQNAAELKDALAQVQNVIDLQPMTQEQAAPEPKPAQEPLAEAEVEIEAPATVTTGANFKVSWSASIHPDDMVTIVAAGADEGKYATYVRVRDKTEDSLVAPAEPGLYEVRYLLNEGRRTLASTPVEVVEADIGIDGPAVARAKSPVRLTWTALVHPDDMVTIVPAGADEGSYTQYVRVRDKLQADLKAPAEPGLYEVRYILNEGRRTLASHALEVLDENAALDDGASLTVPAQAAVGATITVSWTGGADSADQRISLARADQADLSWIAAHKVGTQNTLELKMPAEAGTYEVRYLGVSGRRVLGRAIVEVK